MFTRLDRKRTRLADDVYEQILSAILSGEIVPGERLIQETIATQIDVSRTPVREAFCDLSAKVCWKRRGVAVSRSATLPNRKYKTCTSPERPLKGSQPNS